MYLDLVLLITAVVNVVTSEYSLPKYAPGHDNYASMKYSFRYDIKSPSTGDHKHHWENRNGDAVQGEYGLVDPDGFLRTVQYTSHPDRGFQAIVRRRNISPQQHATSVVQKPATRLYDNVRYALTVTHDAGHSRVEHASSTELLNHRGSPTPPKPQSNTIQNQIADNYKTHKKRIVKKNIAETEFSLYSGESPEIIHKNPILVPNESGFIAQSEWNSGFSLPLQTYTHIPSFIYGPPYINPNSANYKPALNTTVNLQQPGDNNSENQKRLEYVRSLIQEQPYIGSRLQSVHGFQNNVRGFPGQDSQQIPLQHGNVDSGLDNTKLQHALSLIQEQPHIKSQLELIHGSQVFSGGNVEKTLPAYVANGGDPNYFVGQINPNEHKDYTADYLLPNENLASIQNKNNAAKSNIEARILADDIQAIARNNGQFNKQGAVLSQQTKLPLIFVNPQGKFGLPFYPTTKELVVPVANGANFGYEGIPLAGSSPMQNNNPDGATSETIYNAGDPTADREREELVRQMNETCIYFRFNETSPGTEDGTRDNIFNAGDYTAQREEEELIRGTNVTCLNFTADASTNFTSGYTLAQYCSQCLQNNSFIDGYNGSDTNNGNVPENNEFKKNNPNSGNQYIITPEQKIVYESHQPEPIRIVYPNYGYINDVQPNAGLSQLYLSPLAFN